MDALILAAGRGTRLGLNEIPKCLIEFQNTSLIEYQIKCLKEIGVNEIFIVTGYNSEKIKEKLIEQKVNFIHNSEFATTNNIHSIIIAKDFLKDDFICIYGDLFFDKKILKKCANSKNNMTLMIEKNIRDETTRVKIKNDEIIRVNKNIELKEADGNFIGMMKCSKKNNGIFFKSVEDVVKDNSQAYYTIGIEKMIRDGEKVNFDTTDNLPWTDIDTKEDLLLAREVFIRD